MKTLRMRGRTQLWKAPRLSASPLALIAFHPKGEALGDSSTQLHL